MNHIVFHDPPNGPHAHEYLTKIYFKGMRQWLNANGRAVMDDNVLEKIRHATVVTSADYLDRKAIDTLRNNNCYIVAFSCTDSSYVAQCCRDEWSMINIDLTFALTGIQKVNEGHEMVVDQDFNISLEKRQFLPEHIWLTFDALRKAGRIQSLPYVHWTKQPNIPARPYNERSQKVLIRGGNHARRFVLALMLMRKDLLDTNSGFVTAPYFADDMNPQFRYCVPCRQRYRADRKATIGGILPDCTSPARWGDAGSWDTELGKWNNACPRSFYWLAGQFEKKHGLIDRAALEKLLNAQWLTAEEHLAMLARITFTSDLKWLFSIYAAQRFWDAAMVGCINLLPARTRDQEFFPKIEWGDHYLIFPEDGMHNINDALAIEESLYKHISTNARALYTEWIQPTDYALNSNLLSHIFSEMEKHCT